MCALFYIGVVVVATGEPEGDNESVDAKVAGQSTGGAELPETEGELLTNAYRVQPTFLKGAGGKLNLRGAKDVLERAGVTFGPGSSAVYQPAESLLIVRNTVDQLELIEAYIDSGCQPGHEKQVTVIVEFIEVDAGTLSDWTFANRLDSDGTPLRTMLQDLVRQGTARVVETSVIICRSGQRAKTESVSHVIYTSELEPPELPESVSLADGSKVAEGAVVVAATEPRNVGITTEVDAVIGADEVTLDISLAPSLIAEGERSVWPNADVDANSRQQMPGFYRSQITTQVTLKDGRYAFLGTGKPRTPSLDRVDDSVFAIFVRGDISRVEVVELAPVGVND